MLPHTISRTCRSLYNFLTAVLYKSDSVKPKSAHNFFSTFWKNFASFFLYEIHLLCGIGFCMVIVSYVNNVCLSYFYLSFSLFLALLDHSLNHVYLNLLNGKCFAFGSLRSPYLLLLTLLGKVKDTIIINPNRVSYVN